MDSPKIFFSTIEKAGCRNCLVGGQKINLFRVRGANFVGVYHPLIDERLVRSLHRRSKNVYAWTADDLDSMQSMLLQRVDAIVTNNPGNLRRLMQGIRSQCLEDGSLA
ncbi:hypothetical protein MLD38_001162 [Melastoma candidum]|uniref:Uncharacterized protein n=1 Tax=Melastoma candidum TaxID=119954 RepID=A0ACB9SCA0_9MYRT|nr:hypothetical protein MLD38_001162 [Melastoma candidum]